MRTKFRFILVLATLLLSLEGLASSQYDWNMVRDEDGIRVYLKEFWADPIKSFRGIVTINSSIDSLLAVILDIETCTNWVHRCKNPILLFRKSFSECYHYQVHRLPFPAHNREFIFHSKVSRSSRTGVIRIQMQTVPNFCDNDIKACSQITKSSMIRVRHSHGQYLLEPVTDNSTKVTWTHHTDPEGFLPLWLINQLIQEMPYRTLQGLRKKVFEQKYQKARLVLNAQGAIIDIAGIEANSVE